MPDLQMKGKYLICLQGPTASGKTDTALYLAEKLQTEIISADSRQFYREMNIGTAKPTPEQLELVKHHCVSFISVQDKFSAFDFEVYALNVLDNLYKEKDVAIVAGGSGLYLNALLKGFDNIPDVDPQIRASLLQEMEKSGMEHLLERLRKLDPAYSDKADLNNSRRVIRALEVCIGTGKPYSSFLTGNSSERNFIPVKIGISKPINDLYDTINLRCDKMLESGLLDEVKELYPLRKLSPLKTIGYREFFDYIDRKYSLLFAIDLFKQHSRNYAKRQLSWFRRDKEISWFTATEHEKIWELVNNTIN